jgi:predicted phage terminase large subunit-like protein
MPSKRDARSALLSRLPEYQAIRDRLNRSKTIDAPIANIPSLIEFVYESWAVLEGGNQPDRNWHMDAIAFHCQELFMDWLRHKENPLYVQRTQNLVIEVPPGSAKSRIVSVCFTAWAWLHCPSWRVICLSSNPRVAIRDSMYCRDLIESKWFQDRFNPPWRLRYDQNTKSLFSTTAGGWRKALGWGSRITGDRGDCLAAGTIVQTDLGDVKIEDVAANPHKYKVLSHNHATGRNEFKRVVAGRVIHNKNTLKLITGDRTEVECTDDHKLYSRGEYIAASKLRAGDTLWLRGEESSSQQNLSGLLDEKQIRRFDRCRSLLSLRQVNESDSCGRNESGPQRTKGDLLLKAVPNDGDKSITKGASVLLPNLWRRDERGERSEVLFYPVPSSEKREKNGVMPILRKYFSPLQRNCPNVLKGVQRGTSLGADERTWELKLQARNELRKTIQDDEAVNPRARRGGVCGVWAREGCGNDIIRTNTLKDSGSPYRQRQDKQHSPKSNFDVRRVSHDSPSLKSVTISSIERVSDRAQCVYDIQVEGNHNFFANGILVHNCLLSDDPIDAGDAESAVKLQSVVDRWDSAISNRVNDLRSSIRLGIMQRLKEDDWAGHVKAQGGWDSLTIPQEYEGNDAPTVFDWTDPRKTIGELMFPKRFPPEILAAEKLRLGTGYAGQHQQRSTAAGGGAFQIRSWKLYNPRTIPAMRRSMLSIDANFKKGSASDYAVISCIGESEAVRMVPTVYTQIDRDTGLQVPVMAEQRKYYVLDRWRGKVGYSELKSALRQQVAKHPECSIVIVEEAANGHAIMEELQGEIQGLKGFKPGGDSKVGRAAAIAPTQERGDIYLPIAEWAIPTLEAMGLDEISIGDWWDLNPPVSQSNAEHAPIAEWAKEWVNEFAMFPNSANDDQVDSLSQAIIWSRANKPTAIAAATPTAVSADPRDRQRMAQSGVADRLRRQRTGRR